MTSTIILTLACLLAPPKTSVDELIDACRRWEETGGEEVRRDAKEIVAALNMLKKPRTWESRDGKYTTQAELIAYYHADDKQWVFVLEKDNGAHTKVSSQLLSLKDVSYVLSIVKRVRAFLDTAAEDTFHTWRSKDRHTTKAAFVRTEYDSKIKEMIVVLELREGGKIVRVAMTRLDDASRKLTRDIGRKRLAEAARRRKDLEEANRKAEEQRTARENAEWEKHKKTPEYQARLKLSKEAERELKALVLENADDYPFTMGAIKLLIVATQQYLGNTEEVVNTLDRCSAPALRHMSRLARRESCGNLLIQERIELYKLWERALKTWSDSKSD